MKKTAIFIISAFIISALNQGLFAANLKSLAKDDISNAKKSEDKLIKDKDLQEFIPYVNYFDGQNYLKKAAFQFDDEGEYTTSSYFAVLARIEFETARVIAETRLIRKKLLLTEMEMYKNAAKQEMLKAAIEGADLRKEGKSYIANVEDSKMFKTGSLIFLPKGEDILNKIFQVTKLYPQSRLVIKGHTKIRDRDNISSKLKADKIAEYFIINKGMENSRTEVKGVGDQEPMDVGGKDKKVDRVEIIILGAE